MKRILTLLSLAIASTAQADDAAIKKTLTERFPGVVIQSISPTPVPGLFEVYANNSIIYVDAQADYMLSGPLKDTKTKTNLTQKSLEAMQTIDFASLPMDKAILMRHGKGERKLVVFSDPECPYCQALEKELAKLDNVSIYTFLYPLEELHPGATAKADAIWCAPDRAQAWSDYMLDRKLVSPASKCETPVQAISALGAQLGMMGTPAIVFSNGKRVEGSIPAEEIETRLTALSAQKTSAR
jgi:thiol:disulfide interchange protein DsbC